MDRYTARSASDKTEDWPYWFVADETGLNVTGKVYERVYGKRTPGVFTFKDNAILLAALANASLFKSIG